ncbi:MAG: hypothetical protein QM756_04200 [Polyangiaceae bacterium]
MKATSDFRARALVGKGVLLVPLAISSDAGDQRTGVVLSQGVRTAASKATCANVATSWSAGRVLCPGDAKGDAKGDAESALNEVERLFALDEGIPAELWARVRSSSGADHVLLFRPERAGLSQSAPSELPCTQTSAAGLGTAALVSALICSGSTTSAAKSPTEITYVISASLVDVQSGKLLKVGVHSGSDAGSGVPDLSDTELPAAASVLERIMTSLSEQLLTD